MIYVDFEIGMKICALAVYAKSDKADLTEEEKHTLKNAIEILSETYDRR